MPGVHDKVPTMIGGAMPLLNPRCNIENVIFCINEPLMSIYLSRKADFTVCLVYRIVYNSNHCFSWEDTCVA